jgi:hypothetical protein
MTSIRSRSGRRALAAAAALAVVGLLPAVASAKPLPDVQAVCDLSTGTTTVTWSHVNADAVSFIYMSDTSAMSAPYGVTLKGHRAHGTVTDTATPADSWLVMVSVWNDGVQVDGGSGVCS